MIDASLAAGDDLAARLAAVRAAVARAAERAGRDPAEVTIVAVSKGVEAGRVAAAVAAGISHLGENRVQELVAKVASVPEGVAWHFIGRLQTNKVRQLLTQVPVALIHSMDRPALAERISAEAVRLGRVQAVLVQVNVSGEATKAGVTVGEVRDFVRWAAGLPGLAVRGLMTMAPLADDAEAARPHFRTLRSIFLAIKEEGIPGVRMEHLSMGMTNDFVVAVAEGATIVRIGRAIFGEVKPGGGR